MCQKGKWQSKLWVILIARLSKWQRNLSAGVSKWKVAVEVVKNFKWWCVKMGSGGQKWHVILIAAVSTWWVVVTVTNNFEQWHVKWEVGFKKGMGKAAVPDKQVPQV